jgi:hypothetical protein
MELLPPFPRLTTGHRQVDQAWQIALGDLAGNLHPMRLGLLPAPRPVIQAGLVYGHPWTRDAALNTWNAAALLCPTVARDTLRSVLALHPEGPRIDGQYWDAIIWTCGAWHLYLATGDRQFLAEALAATAHSLRFSEATEFSADFGLFRGGACFQDGIAGYPDRYADTVDLGSGIEHWRPRDPAMRHPVGQGFPAHCLSTNCLYFQAYVLAGRMAAALGQDPDPSWTGKATALAAAIRHHFWSPAAGRFRYLVDRWGTCDIEEGFGHAFAILFGLTDATETAGILRTLHRCAAGLPCAWPTFARYARLGPGVYGRHAGTVWPQVNALWAEAAAHHGDTATFAAEFLGLAKLAARDGQFAEIYHPDTTLPYGGVQESGPDHDLRTIWFVGRRQTWCATGFLRMVIHGLFGLRLEPDGLRFTPCVPPAIGEATVAGLRWRGAELTLALRGRGRRCRILLDGQPVTEPVAPPPGDHRIELVSGDEA